MKLSDITQKGEGLMEQGEQLRQRKEQCAQRVSAAGDELAAARASLDAALSEQDENGNPTGDIAGAQARVARAASALQEAQASLERVAAEIERNNREKSGVVEEIGRHNEREQRNLSQLERLRQKRFGGNAAAFAADLAARMNSGEEMRDRLLQSMGLSAGGRRFSAGSGAGGAVSGGAGGFGGMQSADRTGTAAAGAGYRTQDPQQKKAYDLYGKAIRNILTSKLSEQKKSEAIAALNRRFYAMAQKNGWIETGPTVHTLRDIGVALPTKLAMTQACGAMLLDRYARGNPTSRAALQKFGPQLRVTDDAFNVQGAAAHFKPQPGFSGFRMQDGSTFVQYEDRGVHFNAAADMTNPRGAGSTFYHESGHMMDDVVALVLGTSISDSPEFQTALREDYAAFLQRYNAASASERTEFRKRLFDDGYHSLSDLLGGLSGGTIEGKWHHTREYWASSSTLIYKEAVAHFFEASMGAPAKQHAFSQMFPRAQTVFFDLLGRAAADPAVRKRVLRR